MGCERDLILSCRLQGIIATSISWAGASPTAKSFAAVELSFGNGFLKRLEHRQQYKVNLQRLFDVGQHRLTIAGIAYYGKSYIRASCPYFLRMGATPEW